MLCQDVFWDNGPNRIFIVAMGEEVPEIYESLKSNMELIRYEEVSFPMVFAFDLKVPNLFLGLGSHSSKYPCPWCMAEKDKLDELGERRTLGRIRHPADLFSTEGGQAKFFESCCHPPLASGDDSMPVVS